MSYNMTNPAINLTLAVLDPNNSTLTTRPLQFASVSYDPSLAGNTIYLVIFLLLLLAQCGFGIHSRTWGYFGSLFGGLLLEIIGYAARIQMHYNLFLANPFLM